MPTTTPSLLTAVRPWGGEPVDIVLADGSIQEIRPAGAVAPAPEDDILDGRGLLALPGFVNAHAHVDKSWWGRPWVPYGGEGGTQGRIAHERAEREGLGIPSADGAERVLREMLRHGTTAVRSHVDVDLGVGLDGIAAVREAERTLDGAVEVSIVAFPQDGVIRRPGVLDLLDRAAGEGVTAIGGLDPCAIDRDPVAQLDGLFAIAERHGCGIDIHLHSGGDLGAFEYELIIDRTRRSGLTGMVNVAHGFALGQLPSARQEALLGEFAELGISWTTVAPVRSAPLPWVRMRELGIPVGLGTDGIRDLWSPYGDGDLLRVALDFARVHGVRYDEDFAEVLHLATDRAAGFVGWPVAGLEAGAPADIVLIDAQNPADAIVRGPARENVLSGGALVVVHGELLL
ncbi:amidohydrolase family protein [Brachybacterium sp. AOP25-B2-12]|uniref:amidohydrolase family protein n=1 Tax=Brachybacterium sp. AOP25-B2-12 TaxID=3457710 RepID=UPI004034988F